MPGVLFRLGGGLADTLAFLGVDLLRRIEELTESTVKYGLIPHEDWVQPDWIDEEKAKAARQGMIKDNVIYGGAFAFDLGSDTLILISLYRQCPVRLLHSFLRSSLILAFRRYRNMCRFNSGVRGIPQLLAGAQLT